MSATLPGLLQRCLAEALGAYTPIQASADLFARFQRHRLELREGDLLDDSWLTQITNDARQGQAVLVCCNTVKRAQQAYDCLTSNLPLESMVLLHGRFNGRDRLAKEKTVRAATGARSSQRRPVVLVATQVVEVSLDIDLDVIYTDPAPLEALIQRFGRVNRGRRKQWAPVNVFTAPPDGQGIYDGDLVTAALQVVAENSGRLIDEGAISGWLDEIYQGEIAAQWQKIYRTSYDEFNAACLHKLRAFGSDADLENEFYKAFDSIEVLPSCLQGEYEQLTQSEQPLEASQLLVSMQWGQFCQLKRKGLVYPPGEDGPHVVDAPYTSELGLQTRQT
jgi:CRISPR-associated endonuclease/helicase Cas3